MHDDQVSRTGTNFHAVVHAQPPHLTHLSHIAAYRDTRRFNETLLRWQPETAVNLPEGVGVRWTWRRGPAKRTDNAPQ